MNELTVHPLDAEGALAWLRTRPDADASRIVLQGWSNGGSTTLNVMIRQGAHAGFRVALLEPTIRTSTPIAMFLGSDDEEVSPTICQHVAERSLAAARRSTPSPIPARRTISMTRRE